MIFRCGVNMGKWGKRGKCVGTHGEKCREIWGNVGNERDREQLYSLLYTARCNLMPYIAVKAT